jgi:hypothetical protein
VEANMTRPTQIDPAEERARRRDERRWTEPRRQALRVFATAHLCNTAVRESNASTALGAWGGQGDLTCYWQTFRWMVDQGYAVGGTAPRATPGAGLNGPWARLTPFGLAEAERRGLIR